MTTVARSELTNLRMVAGNEKKYSRIIDNGCLKEWCGIGWCRIRTATERDRVIYPVAENTKEPA